MVQRGVFLAKGKKQEQCPCMVAECMHGNSGSIACMDRRQSLPHLPVLAYVYPTSLNLVLVIHFLTLPPSTCDCDTSEAGHKTVTAAVTLSHGQQNIVSWYPAMSLLDKRESMKD